MRLTLMLGLAIVLVALSAGVPGMFSDDESSGHVHSASFDVQVLPGEQMVLATLVLDPKAPVIEVSFEAEGDLFFTQTGQDGVWQAQMTYSPDVECYPVTAHVILATVGAAPANPVEKVKKAKKVKVKKVKAKKSEVAKASSKPEKTKKLKKAKKTKKAEAGPSGVEAVMGALVLELTAESCQSVCEEIMN